MRTSLAEQLRRAIEDSGHTLYRICKATGTQYGVLWRFKVGRSDLRLETASRVADFLGLRLVKADKQERAKR